MTDLSLTAGWPGVYRLEDTTPVLGHNAGNGALPFGADGPSNRQAKDLGQRTELLRKKLEALYLLRVPVVVSTHDLSTLAVEHRGIRVAADIDYAGANTTTIDLPKGEFLVVNECQWPLTIRGPSGVSRVVPARASPDASLALVYLDELDVLVLGESTPILRDVVIDDVSPPTLDSAGSTPITITGKGFLGVIGLEAVTAIAVISPFVVVDDTTITCTVDGPTVGLAAGPESIKVSRTGGEFAISAALTVT